MVKTQVQIPDELFQRAKLLAAEKEWSFAEVVRRGLEQITQINPPNRKAPSQWHLPEGAPMGVPMAPEEEWTALSHEDVTA